LGGTSHYFFGKASFDPQKVTSNGDINYYPWNFGREYQTEQLDYNGSTMLRRVAHTLQQREQVLWWPSWANQAGLDPVNDQPSNDPVIVSTTTTLENGQVAKQSFAYDQFNNRTAGDEFDYGASSPPQFPTRRTEIDYLTVGEVNGIDYTAASLHLVSLPKEQRVYSINQTNGAKLQPAVATTHFYYDQSTPLARSGIIGWQSPGTTACGNLTSTSRWLDTSSTWITTTQKCDVAGSLTEQTDARGNTTLIEYATSSSTYAFPTTFRTPVPDPTGLRGSAARLVTTYDYDFASGKVKSMTDPNGQITTGLYNDALDRLTSVVRPSGAGQTTYFYGDQVGNLFLLTRTAQTASQNIESTVYFDGLGRAKQSAQSEGVRPRYSV
jgi:YD repeat-containing protein